MNLLNSYLEWQSAPLRRHFSDDPDRLYYSIALAHMMFFCAIMMLVFGLVFNLSDASLFSADSKLVFIPAIYGPVLSFTYATVKLRQGHYQLARDIFTFVTMTAIIFSIAFTGGFFHSEATPFLVVIPVMVYLLYGLKSGTLIALFVPLIIASQEIVAQTTGLVLPNYTSTANPYANVVGVNGTMYLLVLAMVASYEHQRSNLKRIIERERQKMSALANSDPLTGLINHRHFHDLLHEAEREVRDTGEKLAILYLDLNKFKQINDDFGHQTGDYILMTVANRLIGMFRDSDVVARLGGDEFAILLRSQTRIEGIENITARLMEKIEEPISYRTQQFEIGAAIGQAISPQNAVTVKTLMEHADHHMYEQKKSRQSIQPSKERRAISDTKKAG